MLFKQAPAKCSAFSPPHSSSPSLCLPASSGVLHTCVSPVASDNLLINKLGQGPRAKLDATVDSTRLWAANYHPSNKLHVTGVAAQPLGPSPSPNQSATDKERLKGCKENGSRARLEREGGRVCRPMLRLMDSINCGTCLTMPFDRLPAFIRLLSPPSPGSKDELLGQPKISLCPFSRMG